MESELISGWTWDKLPSLYGWFNLMWYGILLVGMIGMYFLARKHNEKIDNKVSFIFGVSLIILEIYKETLIGIDDGTYNWALFPFQFCSTPMFISFIAPLLKKGKVQDAMYKFLAFFGLLAGIATMAYPQGLLEWDFITITCHSFIWHTSMVWLGFYLIISKGYCKDLKNISKEIIPGLYIFISVLIIAISMDIIAYKIYFFRFSSAAASFNMFYISPYYGCSLPILSIIRASKIPYAFFVLIYILAFYLGIFLLWLLIYNIRKLFIKIKLMNKNIFKKRKRGVYQS